MKERREGYLGTQPDCILDVVIAELFNIERVGRSDIDQ